MKVKFLRGFGGRETGERHYLVGDVVDFEPDLAKELINREICVPFREKKPKQERQKSESE